MTEKQALLSVFDLEPDNLVAEVQKQLKSQDLEQPRLLISEEDMLALAQACLRLRKEAAAAAHLPFQTSPAVLSGSSSS